MVKKKVFEILSQVFDPEIPVVNIVELGIIKEVICENNSIEIKISPTYSGCPAMNIIEDDIKFQLQKNGFENIVVTKVFSNWTTELLSNETKEKLKSYGIAPPNRINAIEINNEKKIFCPKCNSSKTNLKSKYGSTACKSFYYCENCLEMFEYFKET